MWGVRFRRSSICVIAEEIQVGVFVEHWFMQSRLTLHDAML